MIKFVILMLIIHSGLGQYNDEDNNGKKYFFCYKTNKKQLICCHEITGDGESKHI